MTEVISREDQTSIAVRIVRDLLGDRPAQDVEVEVTRGGTYRIRAKAGDGAMGKHQFSTGRR